MAAAAPSPLLVGRYAIFDRIAAGGMAAVHVGRLVGEGGFARTVAIKRLHPQFALDPEFVAMFLDEARLASRIRHPNVVPTLDVVAVEGELFLVMEYVEGESFSMLLRTARDREERVPIAIASGVMVQALQGLHAAHEAKNDHGEPLQIVHRDVSPQNVLVGADGVARVLDFGVAKAASKLHTTREGQMKGKLGYLSPEQVFGHPVTRRSDVFSASVVLWEAIAGRRLFTAESEGDVLRRIMDGVVEPPSKHAPDVAPALDAIVMKGLAKEPIDRFDGALAMAEALEAAVAPASSRAIAQWVKSLAGEKLAERARMIGSIESNSVVAAPRARVEAEPEKSSVTIATDSLVVPPRRTPWAWVALGAALIAGAAIVGLRARGNDTRAPATAPSAATLVSTPTPTSTSSPTSTPAPTPTSTSSELAAAPASTSAARPPQRPKPRPTAAPSGTSLYTRE